MLFEMSKRALDIFATKKSSMVSNTRWTFVRAMRPANDLVTIQFYLLGY